jgi:hypothetical protein
MRNIGWGLTFGLLAATAVGLGPILLVTVTGQGTDEFEFVGGVGGYLIWAYTAGIVGGITLGAGRRLLNSDFGTRMLVGAIASEAFVLQGLMWDLGEAASDPIIWVFLVLGPFILGALFAPWIVAGFRRSWPSLGTPSVDKDPATLSDGKPDVGQKSPRSE